MSVGVVLSCGPVARAAPDPSPPPEPGIASDPSSLTPIPAGCPLKRAADVAFVGTVVAKDGFIDKGTVRFALDQVRAGDAEPFAVGELIDVRFGPDSQYLEVESSYLVSAAVDPEIGALASKVTPDAPLFGGDAVVGLEDTEVECPTVDDPIQTIDLDGTPIDSGVLAPFFADRRLLLSTLLVPAAIAGAALVGVVVLRRAAGFSVQGIFALGRAAVSPSPDHRASRVRRHASALDPAYAGEDDLDADPPGEADGAWSHDESGDSRRRDDRDDLVDV